MRYPKRRAIDRLSLTFMLFITTVLLLSYHGISERIFEQLTEVGKETTGRSTEDHIKSLLYNRIHDVSAVDLILFGAIILMGLELTSLIARYSGHWIPFKSIPVRGKHLDEFSAKDLLYILLSKMNTAPFMYFYMKFAFEKQNIIWDPSKTTIWNSIVPLPVLFIVFDFFYTILHWFLHLQSIYPYIHKHHHRQKAPSRANLDAINTHPIEFFLGEYNHLLSVYISSKYIFEEIHLAAVLAFVVMGGLLAGYSHTRLDVVISIPFFNNRTIVLFDSKDHDVHHRIPTSNYGQYTMVWDHIFGTHRPYNPNDRINPNYQLDPNKGVTTSLVLEDSKQSRVPKQYSNE